MKHFLFDIGHVLLDFDAEDFLQQVAADTGRPVEPLSEPDLKRIDEVEKGQISDAEFVDYFNTAKGLSWTLEDLTALWVYRQAVQSGVPVYVLSNIAQHHVDAIEQNWAGFFNEAAGLFLSYRIGTRKPDPFIYHHVLEYLEADASRCFFIDDREENITAAREIGLEAYRFIPESHAEVCRAAAGFFGLTNLDA
jgi:putative hydrolase of the HAD superfamily